MRKTFEILGLCTLMTGIMACGASAATALNYGETVTISTDNGSLDLTIDQVHMVPSWDGDTSVSDVNLLMVIDNKNYSPWSYEGREEFLRPYELGMLEGDDGALISVDDMDGFALQQLGVIPYEDGLYNSNSIEFGKKARVCIGFETVPDCKAVRISVFGDYEMNVTFDEDGNGIVSGEVSAAAAGQKNSGDSDTGKETEHAETVTIESLEQRLNELHRNLTKLRSSYTS